MPQGRTYCADRCLASGESMLGTATRVDVWVLLEHPPPWGADALAHNALPPSTRAWLDAMLNAFAAQGLRARAQFIRSADADGADAPPGGWTLFVGREGKLFRWQAASYDDFERLHLPTAPLAPLRETHYFVCTNGQRDLCCARYGLPTFARLREHVGRRVWQTTHLGGHRFAPNVLALPQGVLYGRVFERDAAALAETVDSGAVAVAHLRGRSAYPPEAQAAEAQLRAPGTFTRSDGGRVTFETANGEETVRVKRAQTPIEIIASCGQTETKTVYPYI